MKKVWSLFLSSVLILVAASVGAQQPQQPATPPPPPPAYGTPISLDMARFLSAAEWAAQFSGGLVDATRIEALENSGYDASLTGVTPADLADALAAAPRRMRACDRRP